MNRSTVLHIVFVFRMEPITECLHALLNYTQAKLNGVWHRFLLFIVCESESVE